MYLSSQTASTEIGGDTLHLNDIECFPAAMEADFFDHNDIMISLRNVNTILVFNQNTLKVKYQCLGPFVRQHDPDFVDGRTISVFDNNNVGDYDDGTQSRIVLIDAITGESRVAFEGSKETPFFSDFMGKHQWLPNGNLLVTESVQGRAIEVNPQGEVVWEYINYIEPGRVGLVSEVTRYPISFAEPFADQDTE